MEENKIQEKQNKGALSSLLERPALIYIIIYLAVVLLIIASYKQYPSCFNLCHPSRYLVFMMHTYNGGSIAMDPILESESVAYSPGSMFILAWFAKLLSLPPITVFYFSTFIFVALILATSYLLSKRFFNNEITSLVVVLLFSIIVGQSAIQPPSSLIFEMLSFVAYLYVVSIYLQNPNAKNALAMGATSGATAVLFHVYSFFFTALATMLLLAIRFIHKKQGLKETSINAVLFMLASMLIILPFYLPLYTQYGLKSKNPYIALSMEMSWNILKGFDQKQYFFELFLHSDSIWLFAIDLLFICSLYLVYIRKRKSVNFENQEYRLLFEISAIASLLLVFSDFYLKPIFGSGILAYRFFDFLDFVKPFFIGSAALAVLPKTILSRNTTIIFIATALLVSSAILYPALGTEDTQAGLNPAYSASFITENDAKEFTDFISHNTPPDSVFLADSIRGNIISAATGRKLVFSHFDVATPFADVDKRSADAAVMIYSENEQEVESLIDYYNVSYVVIGPKLMNEFLTSKKYENYLRENSIPHSQQVFNYRSCYVQERCIGTEVIVVPSSDEPRFGTPLFKMFPYYRIFNLRLSTVILLSKKPIEGGSKFEI